MTSTNILRHITTLHTERRAACSWNTIASKGMGARGAATGWELEDQRWELEEWRRERRWEQERRQEEGAVQMGREQRPGEQASRGRGWCGEFCPEDGR